MFIFFLFILLLGCSLYFASSFNNKTSELKRQLIFLTRQNNELKMKLDKNSNILDSLIVLYKKTDIKNCVVISSCNLYIAPTEKSTILCALERNISLNILDSAEILGTIWYEVSFDSDSNINNKGWVMNVNVQPTDLNSDLLK